MQLRYFRRTLFTANCHKEDSLSAGDSVFRLTTGLGLMILAPLCSWSSGDVAFRFRATGSTSRSRRGVVRGLGAGSRDVGGLADGSTKTWSRFPAGDEGAAGGGNAEGPAGGSRTTTFAPLCRPWRSVQIGHQNPQGCGKVDREIAQVYEPPV